MELTAWHSVAHFRSHGDMEASNRSDIRWNSEAFIIEVSE